MEQVLQGKHYNGAVLCHKIAMEGLFGVRWHAFVEWMADRHQSISLGLQEELSSFRAGISSVAFGALSSNAKVRSLFQLYGEYVSSLTSPTQQFWNSDIDMVSLLLLVIETSREGDWQAHLACIRCMLPFMFSFDRVNYSRYMSFF